MKTTENVHGNLRVMPYDVDREWKRVNVARAVLRGAGWVLFVAFFLWLANEIGVGIDRLGKMPS